MELGNSNSIGTKNNDVLEHPVSKALGSESFLHDRVNLAIPDSVRLSTKYPRARSA